MVGAIPVYAQDVTKNEAVSAIQQAEKDIQEMAGAGFSTDSVSDILAQAGLALERADFAEIIRSNATGKLAEDARKALEGLNYQGFTYEAVLENTQEIASRKKQAYALSDSLRAAEIRIGDYKNQRIDVTDAEGILEDAKTAFEKERYDEVEILLLKVRSELDEKRAEVSTLNTIVESGRSYFEKNWINFAVATVVVVFVAWLVWKFYRTKRIRVKLERLKTEQKVLIKLMKKAQVERFETAEISESVYEIRMEKYNERLEEIKARIPVLESMLKSDSLTVYFDKTFGRKIAKCKEEKPPKKKVEKARKKEIKKVGKPFWKNLEFLIARPRERKKKGKKPKKKEAVLRKIEIEKKGAGFFEKIRKSFEGRRAKRKEKFEEGEREPEFREEKIEREFPRVAAREIEKKEEEEPKPSKLQEVIASWKGEAAKIGSENERRKALERLYQKKKTYTFRQKSYKPSNFSLRLKKLIARIRFKIA